MAKFCSNCGSALVDGSNYCLNCGSSTTPAEVKVQADSSKNGDLIIILYAIFKVLSIIFIAISLFSFSLLDFKFTNNIAIIVASFFAIASFITIIVGFIKYSKNRAIKIIFWIEITIKILITVICIISILACVNTYERVKDIYETIANFYNNHFQH